jgi:transposase
MGRCGYPLEFRRTVLDLVEAGRPIAEIAKALGISAQSIYTWRRQDRIDKGLTPGLSSPEMAWVSGDSPRRPPAPTLADAVSDPHGFS